MTNSGIFMKGVGYWAILICFICSALSAVAQKPPETQQEFEEAYQRRIRQERLYGVYIPKDMADAFVQLNQKIDAPNQQIFKDLSEEEAVNKLFYSLGRWIIHNWGFYGGSRLSHYLRQLGISHPEDMATFIIITYHRNLNRKPLEVKPLIESLQEKRQKERLEKLENGEVIHEETRKRKGN